MPKSLESAYLEAAKAEDLNNLLEHIAWTETIRPALFHERDTITNQLVSSTLGLPIRGRDATGGTVEFSREQLAGKIYGINYIITLFENILRGGRRAAEQLRDANINLS